MVLTEPSSTYTTFPLFNDLLPELRLKVYEFALASPKLLSFTHEDYLHQGELSAWSLSIFRGVSLLRSSWKTYNEALPVFYAVNHFHFDLEANWEHVSRSTHLSDHIAMIKSIVVEAWVDERSFIPDASRVKELLRLFPRLHRFMFVAFRSYSWMTCPPLNKIAETLGDLRHRLRSMAIMFNSDDEENLKRLRDVIAPQGGWQHAYGDEWHVYSIGPSGQAGVRDMNRPECRIEEL